MKIFLTLLVLVLLPNSYAAAAADQKAYYIEREATGSRIPIRLIKSSIPFDKSYASLNDADKATLRSYYEGLPSDTVPPFPKVGLKNIASDLEAAHNKMRKAGPLFATASVDETGKVSKVSVYSSPHEKMTQLISAVLWETEFQAATCAGEPCAMDFVLDWELMRVRGSAITDNEQKTRNSKR